MKIHLIRLVKLIGGILGVVLLYLLCSFFIPMIETPEEQTSTPKNIETYILTNGVHTDLVMPIKTHLIDWSQKIPFENTVSQRTDFRYIAFGWGDKGFYLDTPTWADLKFSTAFKAAFWLGESAIHATYYEKMTLGEDCRKVMLTEEQYSRLIRFIDRSFDKDAKGNYILIKTNAVYGKNDAFYEAGGSYSFLHTCNTWTNNGLKTAGQKAAFWTPTDTGIFRHYK
ncbi:MAG: TIGR02117 family protein [Cloacibacterium sp.]|nr:TIGR02117 family protein [Cloacibacterium sp.]